MDQQGMSGFKVHTCGCMEAPSFHGDTVSWSTSRCACVSLQIWTSQLKRTIQTGNYLSGTIEQWKALNELDVVRAVDFCLI